MIQGKSKEYKEDVESIYQSLREKFGVLENDKFIVIHEHSEDNFFKVKGMISTTNAFPWMILTYCISRAGIRLLVHFMTNQGH